MSTHAAGAVSKLSTGSATQTSVFEPEVGWMDLKIASRYVSVSTRTLREWIHLDEDPLPASQGKHKLLIRRQDLDRWLERRRVQPTDYDLGAVVNEVMDEVTQ